MSLAIEGFHNTTSRPIVIVSNLNEDVINLRHQFLAAFDYIGLALEFDRSRAIFIKPNLTYPYFKAGVTTRQQFVASLVEALRKINKTTKIYIGEGEGGYNSFSMTEAMRNIGFYEIAETFPNVEIVNLSHMETRTVEVRAKGKSYSINLPELFFSEIDFSITCPLPKVHCMTTVTLSLKNQWGCLPDTMRLKHHHVFNEIIGQICKKLKFRYAFLDGKYGLNKNGPMMGDPLEVNWFVASNSLGAFDMIVSEMMGFNWKRVGHLKMAAQNGLLPQKENIEIIGDIESLRRKFVLKRNFWNYPALAAFHSRNLTNLFYFSKLAKPLHSLMYTFRKRDL